MANYQTQLQSLGYKYDTTSTTGYTKINGFAFSVHIDASSKVYTVSAACRPQDQNGEAEMNKYLQQFASERKKNVNIAAFNNNNIVISYNIGMTANITANVKEAGDAILYFASQCGFIPVCPQCGQPLNTDFYSISGKVVSLCPNCFSNAQNSVMANAQAEAETVTNYPLGILGAALGGLAGAVIWIIFSMLGRIVFLAGFAAGSGGLFGFQKLGKKMSNAGIVISLVISLAMLFAGMYFALAIDVYNAFSEYYNISFSDSFSLIPYIFQDSEMLSAICMDWGIGLVTFIVSAVISIIHFKKERKVKNQAVKLS